MKILMAIDYYRPNVSGLTLYAEHLAEGLAERGRENAGAELGRAARRERHDEADRPVGVLRAGSGRKGGERRCGE